MARIATSVSYSFTVRLRIVNNLGMFAKVLHAIARQQGDPGAVDVVRADRSFKVRDLTVNARDDEHARATAITESMKLAAAKAIAGCITPDELSEEDIIPSVFNKQVSRRVARAVEQAAYDGNVGKRPRG